MIQDTQNTNRPLALLLSLLFHGLVLVLLFFVAMHTPIPPYPMVGGGSGLEVNFGTSDEGMGDIQPEEYLPVETRDLKALEEGSTQDQSAPGQDEEMLTQDVEDAPQVKTSTSTSAKTGTNAVKINDPVVNPLALYKKRQKGGNEGETGKAGDQGHPQGSLYAKNHYGEPGSGDGTGKGTGIGTGIGSGIGPSFDLSGRTAKYLPKPEYNISEQGTVVVRIWVNKDGQVVRTEAGAKGTTTSSQQLYRLAQQAAARARFSPNANAPEEQKGTITYHFVLQN